MERVPEPELMEDEAQALAYARADFEEPHSHFIAMLREATGELPEAGHALDLGCGPADITIRFAQAFPGWRVDGLDGSRAMLEPGFEAVERAGLADRVQLHERYLPGGEPPRASYDLVLSNSLLHHLADPSVIWKCTRAWGAPGAPVFVMDLMRPATAGEVSRLVDEHSAGEPEVLRRDFHNSLLAAYRVDEVRAQLAAAGLDHLTVQAVSDRHFTVSGRV